MKYKIRQAIVVILLSVIISSVYLSLTKTKNNSNNNTNEKKQESAQNQNQAKEEPEIIDFTKSNDLIYVDGVTENEYSSNISLKDPKGVYNEYLGYKIPSGKYKATNTSDSTISIYINSNETKIDTGLEVLLYSRAVRDIKSGDSVTINVQENEHLNIIPAKKGNGFKLDRIGDAENSAEDKTPLYRDENESSLDLPDLYNVDYSKVIQNISYEELARYPDKYYQKDVAFSGKILQVINDADSKSYRIAMNDEYNTVVLVNYPNKNAKAYKEMKSIDNIEVGNLLEDDYVIVIGQSIGIYEYTTVMGAKQSIPAIYAYIIHLSEN